MNPRAHPRHRSRAGDDRLRRHRCRRPAAAVRRQRHDPHQAIQIGQLPARLKTDLRRRARGQRALPADLRGGRDRLRQRQSAVDAAARTGARGGDHRAGRGRARGVGIHGAADEEGDRRPRPCAQGAGPADGDAPARAAGSARQGRRRCARPGDLPCPCRRVVCCDGQGGDADAALARASSGADAPIESLGGPAGPVAYNFAFDRAARGVRIPTLFTRSGAST